MNDATPAGDGPITTQPEGNPDFSMPGDSPLADAPMPTAPDSTEPAAPDEDTSAPDEATPPPANGASDEPPPLPGETAAEEPTGDESAGEAAPADARPEPRRLSRGEREMVERTRQRFAACGRCGYLIADLYLLLGEDALQTAAIAARDGWLRLEGDNDGLRTLLVDAFGVRLDIDYEAMDGACPECRRRFVFAVIEDGRARLKLRT